MYKLTQSETIVRLSDNACIPNDPANSDYAEYLKWVAEGNTPEPVDPPTPDQIQAELKKTAYAELTTNSEAGFKSSIRDIEMTYREIDCVRFSMSKVTNMVRDKYNINHTVTDDEFNIIKNEVLTHASNEQIAYWAKVDV